MRAPFVLSRDDAVIALTNGGFSICDANDFDRISQFNWFSVKDGNIAYAMRGERGRLVRMHSEILGHKFIDHINGDGLDNRRSNLRAATASQNGMNRGKFAKSHSKFKGVTFSKKDNKWTSRIKANGKRISLGYFRDEMAAAIAYNNAAIKFFGPFARLNQI